LREPKIRHCACGMVATIAGLSLYSYHVRELLVSLALFSVAFFFMALAALGALLVWCASEQVAIWITPAAGNVFARSRRLFAACVRSWTAKKSSNRVLGLRPIEQAAQFITPGTLAGERGSNFSAFVLDRSSGIPIIRSAEHFPPEALFADTQAP
jgi:hypothetical protein